MVGFLTLRLAHDGGSERHPLCGGTVIYFTMYADPTPTAALAPLDALSAVYGTFGRCLGSSVAGMLPSR